MATMYRCRHIIVYQRIVQVLVHHEHLPGMIPGGAEKRKVTCNHCLSRRLRASKVMKAQLTESKTDHKKKQEKKSCGHRPHLNVLHSPFSNELLLQVYEEHDANKGTLLHQSVPTLAAGKKALQLLSP